MLKLILILLGLALLLMMGPWLFIWGINTLAAAAGAAWTIPFTFWTWLAALVLGGISWIPSSRRG